jgi:hypothetical protein
VTKNNLNVSLTALRVAAQTRIPIAIKSLDKLAGFGIDADWNVKMVKEDQDKDKEDTVDFEISICTLYRDPTWTNPS